MSGSQFVFTQESRRQLLKDRVQALRTIWWYRVVADRLGACGPHQVGRLATPDRYRIDGVTHKYRADWPRYAAGARSPSGATLDQVDQFVPGSARVYRHPLWAILLGRRQPQRGWLQLAMNGPIAASEFLNRDPKAALNATSAASIFDIVSSLLALRHYREAIKNSTGNGDLDRLLIKVCLVAAAQDRAGLPFPGLTRVLNLYFWAHSTQPFPFFPLSVFCHTVLTMRRCQPEDARAFECSSDEERRVIAVAAVSGKFGWDLPLASLPIYLCDCARDCEHLQAARRTRRLMYACMKTIRFGVNWQ